MLTHRDTIQGDDVRAGFFGWDMIRGRGVRLRMLEHGDTMHLGRNSRKGKCDRSKFGD